MALYSNIASARAQLTGAPTDRYVCRREHFS